MVAVLEFLEERRIANCRDIHRHAREKFVEIPQRNVLAAFTVCSVPFRDLELDHPA